MEKIIITICSDFTDAPGARFRTDGDKSGQEFYEDLLRPKFIEATKANKILFIDLDNTWGYASSFISQSFGVLAKEFPEDVIRKHLQFKTEDDPLLLEKIEAEMVKQRNAK